MTIKLTVTELEKGPFLKLVCSVINGSSSDSEAVSKEFNINNLAMVKLKLVYTNSSTSCFLSWKKHYAAEKYTVKINVICETNGQSEQFICTQNWSDSIIYKFQMNGYHTVFPFVVAMSVIKLEPISFANFYEETDFCDFRLSTADGSGSVAVHKLCLIAHSDTFKTMLSSKWKETEDGCIEIPEATLQTLQNLKKYLYLGTLPDTEDDLCQLLLLAKCYLIGNLKEECIAKLAREVKPENLQKLQDFAFDNKLAELMRAITYLTPDKTIQNAHKIEVRSKQASSKSDGK